MNIQQIQNEIEKIDKDIKELQNDINIYNTGKNEILDLPAAIRRFCGNDRLKILEKEILEIRYQGMSEKDLRQLITHSKKESLEYLILKKILVKPVDFDNLIKDYEEKINLKNIEKKKLDVKKKYFEADSDAKRVKIWFDRGYVSQNYVQNYNSIIRDLEESNFNNMDINKTDKNLSSIKGRIEEIKSTIKKDIENTKIQLNQNKDESNKLSININELKNKAKNNSIIIISLLYIVFFINDYLNILRIIFYIIIVFILLEWLFPDYIKRFDIKDKIIGTFALFISVNIVVFLFSNKLSEVLIQFIFLILVFIPLIKLSDNSIFKRKQIIDNEIKNLYDRISIGEKALGVQKFT